MNVHRMLRLITATGRQVRIPCVRAPQTKPSRTRNPPAASPGEARLAVCRRMSTPCLLRRVGRGRWSRTSHAAAVRILEDRAPMYREV